MQVLNLKYCAGITCHWISFWCNSICWYVDLITFANCSIGDCFGHDRGILLNILSSIIFSVTKFTACVCRFYDE